MSPTTASPLFRSVAEAVGELRARNRVLFAVALANFALAVVFTALMQLDGRMLLGRNVWTKPWKFATSIAVFTATVGWILPSLGVTDRVEKLVTYIIGGAMSIEIALISLQAGRGVASHFNTSTPLDSSVFMIMGVTITISSIAVAYLLWRVARDPPDLAPAYLWGIMIGMLLFVVASFEGWLMVSQQSHAVGAANDSPGILLLNWSMTGGDLRISHFVGLHALQVLPLTGYYAARWQSDRRSLVTLGVVSALYTLFIGLTFTLALLGTPLVQSALLSGAPVSAAAGTLLALSVTGALVLATLWRRHRTPSATAG